MRRNLCGASWSRDHRSGGEKSFRWLGRWWTEIGDAGRRVLLPAALAALIGGCGLGLSGCAGSPEGEQAPVLEPVQSVEAPGGGDTAAAVRFDRELDEYQPRKRAYRFYFTYKAVHPWWDAVAMGMEDAARQYENMGVVIDYEYLAPREVSAQDQIRRLEDAAERGFDVIGVDVADVAAVTPAINALIADGERVMTFSSSDAAKEDGCTRIAYVGNTHNYEDGAALTEALCEKLDFRGKVAVLVGTEGAPCHEERARGARDVLARYPEMELVELGYDGDAVDKAYRLTQDFLERQPDLAGIVCCNMSNPAGAARAVVEAGRSDSVVIVGMDHDQEALRYLRSGVIYALGVQDCYSIGFDTIQVAIRIADGGLPGEDYPEKTEERTTLIYQDGAAAMLEILYGEIL